MESFVHLVVLQFESDAVIPGVQLKIWSPVILRNATVSCSILGKEDKNLPKKPFGPGLGGSRRSPGAGEHTRVEGLIGETWGKFQEKRTVIGSACDLLAAIAVVGVLVTMHIPTCFFFACLTAVSHVWGRVSSQGSGRLKLTVLSEDRLQMKWKETEGNISGYKVRVKPMAGDSEQEVMLKTKTPKATVAGLSPTKEYTLQVYVLNGSQEALFAKRKFVIEELKNASQTRNNRRNSGTISEKNLTSPGSSTAEHDSASATTSPPLTVVLTQTAKDRTERKRQKGSHAKVSGEAMRNRASAEASVTEATATSTRSPQRTPANTGRESPGKEKPTKDSLKRGSQFQCDTSAMIDIVLLVDGSWSIGRNNFKLIKEFLSTLISPFNIAQDKIRIGLSQYSSDPRTEWDLNTYTTRDEVLEAVRNLRYKGGNTFTGLALTHVLEQNLKPESGARLEAEKLVILLTDGKSQDDANLVAQTLKNMGIEIFAI
ncbi:PREDICTED: collagen alpha-1(XX) chain-like, partial [Tinamus guttatus]|uniref:collagen alpha-1(XX) chain-like n=1 Tax=Tinamus guttatus TaxID=94827 RepID=UPI00052F3863